MSFRHTGGVTHRGHLGGVGLGSRLYQGGLVRDGGSRVWTFDEWERTRVAQRVVTEFVDDIDGSPAGETVAFALDGVSYEIDLSDEHTEELREALAGWVSYARRVGGRARRASRGPAPVAQVAEIVAIPADSKTVRSWAEANGIAVPVRGRIPGAVRRQFEAANG
jgi:hypothetical protein